MMFAHTCAHTLLLCCCCCCRKFIEQHYVELKQQHPKFPILIRECSGVEPQLYGRFGEWGGEGCGECTAVRQVW